ncbi:MAG: bifunctional oligoribonuclease/PAP phosphatase NrnA [Bacteroidales bacterium]|nr:bifunctional oligoribonuclease/PAP phosphatase NrnA [Bacteroidales bacterium]
MLSVHQKRRISQVIGENRPVVIISHINPDGDSIGSSLAFAMYLKKHELDVTVIIPNEVPEFLNWLPGYELVKIYSKSKGACIDMVANAGTIFLVDFNDPDRLGGLKDYLEKSDAFKMLIDHHQRPVEFTDTTISEPWRGSVGEMIYLLIKDMGDQQLIDKNIATCLYVAIITDTGNFRYGSSYSEIFSIAGDLVEKGIDKDMIFSLVYDSYSVERMKLLGYCMSEKLVVLQKYHTAYIYISKEELNKYNHQVGDTEGFVNVPFSIKGVKVTALMIEKSDHVKLSLRSKGPFSVDRFAAEYFSGGGHINAAGGQSDISLQETTKRFEELIARHADEIV